MHAWITRTPLKFYYHAQVLNQQGSVIICSRRGGEAK